MTGRALLAGVVVAAAGLVAGVVALRRGPALPLPVTADLRGPGGPAVGDRAEPGEVDGRVALLVPAAVVLAAVVAGRQGRPAVQRLLPVGSATPIAVFLVAQLNGVRDLGALVLVYAATAGSALMRSVPGRWPWSIAAMVGIVPWGVVAFHQLGARAAGRRVPRGVERLTLMVLGATVAEFLRGGRSPAVPRPAPVLVALGPALLAAGSLLL